MLKWDKTKKRKNRNPLAGKRGRRKAGDEDSPVARGRRRSIPPIVENEEDEDPDATIIPSPQSMAGSPQIDLASPP